MKKNLAGLLLLLFTLFLSLTGLSQTITVVDKATWLPLPGVTVSESKGVAVQTDVKGQADISQFAATTDSVYLTYIGYQSRSVAKEWLRAQQYKVAMVQQAHDIGEVVISAGKFSQQRRLVPQQIEVLQAKDVAFASQPTTADLMQQTGKILIQKSQLGGGSPIIRGFEANKVLLVVDGVRMNNAIYRGGHLQNIITLDNSVLDRAEVLFGPGSVIYGSDALGGVLHFYTKKPLLAAHGQKYEINAAAYSRYSSAPDEKTVHAQVNYGRGKWASLTGITYSDFSNMRQGSRRTGSYGELGVRNFHAARIGNRDTMLLNPDPNVQRPTGYKQYDLLQKVLFQPSVKASLEFNLQLSTSSDIPRYDRLTEITAAGKLKHAQWYYGPQDRLLAAYTYTLKDTARLYDQAKVVASFQRLEESRHNRSFGKNGLAHRTEEVYVYGLNAAFSKQLRGHQLQYGFEANYNAVGSSAFEENILTDATKPISTRYPDGGSSMQSMAAFITHTWDVTPELVLTQGLRSEWVRLQATFDDKSFFPFLEDEVVQQNQALSGSIGANWLPGRDWRLSLIGASGFRAPNVDDLSKVFDSTPGNVLVPNPGVKPEYTYTTEIGVSKTIAKRIFVELIGYHTWYRAALAVRPFQLQGQDSILYEGQLSRVMANVNAGNAYIYGYSASVAADLSNSLSLTSSLNYTYGRVKEKAGEVPLDHIPPFHGKTSLNLNLKKLRGEFFVLYNGQKRLQNYSPSGEDNLQYATPDGMPAWYTLNLRTAYQLTPHLQVQAALENITDRYYRVFASGISAPGRNVVLTLRANI